MRSSNSTWKPPVTVKQAIIDTAATNQPRDAISLIYSRHKQRARSTYLMDYGMMPIRLALKI